ncbi:MAG: prepilin-type N-terminal cleavage/methylation domain-containing protein [Candidatus Paceibacterota bacterium]
MKKNKGFTLIELLVVIAIIGILSSVVLASLNSARQKSRDARRIADIKQVQLALELYFDSNANYPTALSALAPSFIPVIPVDPQSNAVYSYVALGSGTTCSSYHLGATLEDGTHQALDADVDALVGTACTGGGTDFAGADPLYDVKP